MTVAIDEELFTLAEIADHLKVPIARARQMRRVGRFPHAINVGTKRRPEWRIPAGDLLAIKNN